MGIDNKRFMSIVPANLKCSICLDVLLMPVTNKSCKHVFCERCITVWIHQNQVGENGNLGTCPLDKKCIDEFELKPANKVQKEIRQLEVKCWNSSRGCNQVMKLDNESEHMRVCIHKPMKMNPKAKRVER